MSFWPDTTRILGPLEHDVCRRGFLLIAKDGAKLPPRCICCNEGVEGPLLKRRFAWHQPALMLFLFVAPLPYLIIRPFILKRGTLHVAICPTHREYFRMHAMFRWGVVLAGLLAVVLAIASLVLMGISVFYWLLFLLGYGLLMAAVFYRPLMKLLRPFQVQKGVVQLQGADRKFLDSLPDISPPRALPGAAALPWNS